MVDAGFYGRRIIKRRERIRRKKTVSQGWFSFDSFLLLIIPLPLFGYFTQNRRTKSGKKKYEIEK